MSVSASDKVLIGVRTGVTFCVLSSTGLRLYCRGCSRWGWDDGLVCVGCVWMTIHAFTSTQESLRLGKEDSLQLALFYVSFFCFQLIIWFARLSILASIIRITPVPRDKSFRRAVFVGFIVAFTVEIGQLIGLCSANTAFSPTMHNPQCFNHQQVILLHLIASVLSDSLLLVFPLCTLRCLKSSAPRIRRRLSLVYIASTCTTIFSVVTSLLILIAHQFVHGYITFLEGSTSLFVCNLPVLCVAACHVLGISDRSRAGKTLPPIEFAPRQKSGDSILPSSSTPQQRTGTRSFVTSLPAIVREDEDECDKEVTRIWSETRFDEFLGEEAGVKRVDTESTSSPRRHSMHI